MDIKDIADKIIKESDVNPVEYEVADRIVDINTEYLKLIELATQIGSKFPISAGGDNTESFTIVDGDQTLTRTIKDTSIQKVEYRAVATDDWECMDRDTERCHNCFAFNNSHFIANEKQVFLEDAYAGFLKVTYDRANITVFTTADYSLGTPPSPDWLPETFHPLLWMKPALDMAELYKPDRVAKIEKDRDELLILFRNHYGRDAETIVETDDEEEEPNYR